MDIGQIVAGSKRNVRDDIMESIEEIIENFDFLEDWEEKYKYIIDLGSKLEGLPEADKNYLWKVEGCQSQVWLKPDIQDGKIIFKADSDAIIVKGLIAIVLQIYSNKSAKEIKDIEVDKIFDKLGLREHLSPSRRNGLMALVSKIKGYAQ